jgi:flagellar hook-length control protein FliK
MEQGLSIMEMVAPQTEAPKVKARPVEADADFEKELQNSIEGMETGDAAGEERSVEVKVEGSEDTAEAEPPKSQVVLDVAPVIESPTAGEEAELVVNDGAGIVLAAAQENSAQVQETQPETEEDVKLETKDGDAAETIVIPTPAPIETKQTAKPSLEIANEAQARAPEVNPPQNGPGLPDQSDNAADEAPLSARGQKAQGAASAATVEDETFSALFDLEDEGFLLAGETPEVALSEKGAEGARAIDAPDAVVTAAKAEPEQAVIKVQVDAIAREAQSSAQTNQVKPASQAFVNELGERVVAVFRANLNKATIRLDPPELGHLKIDLSVKDNVLKASISADTMVTKELLENAVAGLKSALSRHGLSVDEINIFLDNAPDRGRFSGEGAGSGRDRGFSAGGRDGAFGSHDPRGAREVVLNIPVSDRAIDIFI